jgi:hypothetical protein
MTRSASRRSTGKSISRYILQDAERLAAGGSDEVRYSEWTSDGSLRHPAFLGLREDKAAGEVVREAIGRGEG